MAGKTPKKKATASRTRTTSSRKRAARPAPKSAPKPAPARMSAAEPLWDLCTSYHGIRPILQALLEADVLNPSQDADFRLFMAMMDVLCGAARARKGGTKSGRRKASRRAN
jgi:hypothetical protein